MKRVRATIAFFLVLLTLLAGCGEQGVYKTIGKPLYEEQFSVCFRSGDRLRDYVTAALEVLAADGALGELSRRWFGADLTLLKGNASALEALGEEIPARKLIVGVSPGSAPLCFKDANGALTGFDIELTGLIVSRLGWTADFYVTSETEIAAQLGSGNVDCALGGINASLYGAKVAASPAYLGSEKVLAAMSGSAIKSVKGLGGKVLATTFDPAADAALAASEGLRDSLGSVKKLGSALECFELLAAGGCDAIIVDSLALQYYSRLHT